MFRFRHDKVGFFAGLVLIIICGGTLIATVVLLLSGALLGDFQMFVWPIKWVLLGWWFYREPFGWREAVLGLFVAQFDFDQHGQLLSQCGCGGVEALGDLQRIHCIDGVE